MFQLCMQTTFLSDLKALCTVSAILRVCLHFLILYISRHRPTLISPSTTSKPGFHLQQTPRPGHKKQSDYVFEQSSSPLIALFWLKIGHCRGRNWIYGNQALTIMQNNNLFDILARHNLVN